MNALLFESAVWLRPLIWEEEAGEEREFIYHTPVLVREAVDFLGVQPGKLVLDATCGGGGHAEAILRAGGNVLGLDQDPEAIGAAADRLAPFGNRVTLRQANFRFADRVLDSLGISKVDGALLDLGVSSRQLENAARGFSLMQNGPLDMRMDPRGELTAEAIVNGFGEEELAHLFRERGEEPASRRIARAVVAERKSRPLRETRELAALVEKVAGRHGRRHPATRIFQALRMEVNDEIGALQQGLRVITEQLAPGGRIAVISFHSLEDRMVKNFFREHSRALIDRPEWATARSNPAYDLRLITPKPVLPGTNEERDNPRARSAKLRVAEKLG